MEAASDNGGAAKNKLKKFFKSMSKENIKQKLARKPSKEKIPVFREKDANAPPPPIAAPQTGVPPQSPLPEPKSPLAKSPRGKKKSSPFKKAAASPPPTAPPLPTTPPPVTPVAKHSPAPLLKKIDEAAAASGDSGGNKILKCSRVLGAAVLLFVLKNALSGRKKQTKI